MARTPTSSKASPDSVQSVVAATIAKHALLKADDVVLVAFSGGADSTALALTLSGLGYQILLGHVDHQMRADSAGDAEHCRRIAASLAVPIEVAEVRVNPPTEAAARRVRYEALSKIAKEAGADKIATGHTLDDNVETILMRLARGGRAFPIPAKRGRIIRPLIGIRRKLTESVCRREGIEFLVDPTNFDEKFTRNRIRLRMLPNLSDDDYKNLLATAEANRAEADDTLAIVLGAEARGELSYSDQGSRLSRRWLSTASLPVRMAALRRAVELLGEEATDRLIRDIERKVLSRTGAGLDLPGGWRVWAEPDDVVFGLPADNADLPEVPLKVPGTTLAPEWSFEVRTSFEASSRFLFGPATNSVANRDKNTTHGGDRVPTAEAVLDADLLGDGLLTIRSWKPSDRFHPLGAPGTKKLQDFFVDSKVPKSGRSRTPIFVSGGEIVWVAGGRIDERYKLTPASRRALRIQIFSLLQEE